MTIRTYFWKERIHPKWKIALRDLIKRDGYNYFTVGNAGDILVENIINWYYDEDVKLVADEGSRLLLVGSINNQVKKNDLLLGIGARSEQIDPQLTRDVLIHGLRGPKSYEAFKSNGYDVSQIKFLYDPGLLVRYMWDYSDVEVEKNKVIFIPHFRDRGYYKTPVKGIQFVDIDDYPERIAKQVFSAEMVYTSSLHGLIFAHALGRPAKLVMPQSKEPRFKYEDYMLSVGSELGTPIDDLYKVKNFGLYESPLDLNFNEKDFVFPSYDELQRLGVAR